MRAATNRFGRTKACKRDKAKPFLPNMFKNDGGNTGNSIVGSFPQVVKSSFIFLTNHCWLVSLFLSEPGIKGAKSMLGQIQVVTENQVLKSTISGKLINSHFGTIFFFNVTFHKLWSTHQPGNKQRNPASKVSCKLSKLD